MSNEQIILVGVRTDSASDFIPHKVEYPNIHVSDLSLSWSLSLKTDASEPIRKIKADIAEYNDYLNIPDGFPSPVRSEEIIIPVETKSLIRS